MNLTIKVRRKYKNNLDEGWGPKNWKWNKIGEYWESVMPCELCKRFFGCRRCPFHKFEDKNKRFGCMIWIHFLVPKFSRLNKSTFKKNLLELRRLAKKHIIFY